MASESPESKEEIHHFSGKESPLHPHHKAEFQVDGVKYNYVEQYVLHKKAELCKATKDAAELMKITDPNHLKQFEKKFIIPDRDSWEARHKEFMKKGYLEKSRQVKDLFNLLHDTKGKNLAYATRKDSVLGIGVDANDPLSRRKSNWKGKNLLGEWLMEIREQLPDQQESSVDGIASEQETTDGSPQHKETVKEKESSGPEKFTFFWRKESPFSQWHPCSFVIDDQWYNCAEQYMMHQKAVMFGDHLSAQKILRSKDPDEQKKLGRKVENFDDKQWSPVSMEVVKKGNLAKFGQDKKLKGILFETVGTTLVEASPVDTIWGIGLAANDPRAKNRKQWLGYNQLGQVLTEVREELMSLEREKAASKDGESSHGTRQKDDAGKPAKRRADGLSEGQERKRTEGATDAKVPKGRDPTALNKEADQRKGDSPGGKNKRSETQRQNSSQRRDKKVKEDNIDVQMRSEVDNLKDVKSNAERVNQDIGLSNKTEKSVDSGSLSKPCNETSMEYSDANLHDGKEEAENVADPSWEGFNSMELDIEEDSEEKKKRERHKDDYRGRNDKDWSRKKGKTGNNYRQEQEQEKPGAEFKFDDQALPEKFTFFWRADSPFSQHHPANFTIDGIQYNCAEQFMMHQKAVVFRDDRTGYEIMHTSSPAKQKSLAKQVEGFDEVHWKTLRRDVVKRGNIAKFSQNPRLRRMLFATAGTTMVEASPVDVTWGIGLSADDPKAWHRWTWAGGNLLGEILTEVRDELMGRCQTFPVEEDDRGSYKNSDRSDEQFTIFWRPVSPFHPRYPMGFELDNQFYQTLQQYLLHQKALFFKDSLTARNILEHVRPNKLDEFGRNIRDYDHRVWSRFCRSYLRLGNFAKFSQNPNIGQQLIDNVQNGELVFAVEEDRLLGVGLKEEDGRLYRKGSWKGKNLLGQALMEVREMLMKNVQALPEILEYPEDEDTIEDIPECHVRFFFNDPPFSQWRPSRFSIRNVQYSHAEQYMIHQMALHFRDKDAAEAVMHCRHPKEMQTIDIRNYNQREWKEVCREIVMEGNRAKFMQDHKAREDLLKTDDSILAYAAVNDTLLGIGLRDSDPRARDPQNWPGFNVLGDVLMEIREELKKQRSNSNNSCRRRQSESQESQPDEKFTFFWQRSPFSQWWMCDIRIDGTVYNCSEQYMMHRKALFFNDQQTADDIMTTATAFDQLQLGRRIRGYVSDKWNAVCEDVVRTGSMAKFSQHPRMRRQLFETVGTTLVEASPKDCKWGIGLTKDDPRAKKRDTWIGRNLLGQILTEVRDELMKQENSDTQAHSASNISGSGSGRDRRGSERSDNSQGYGKNFESHPKGFSHESHQKSTPDHGGAAGSLYHEAGSQHRESGNQRREAEGQYREAGNQYRGAGSQRHEAGSQHRKSGNQRREAEGQYHEAGNQHHEAGSQHRESGNQRREAGNQYREAGNQHREAEGQYREAGNQYHEAENQRHETGSQRHEAGSQHHDRKNLWYRQNPKSERIDNVRRPPDQHRHEGNERPQPFSRSFHKERSHVAESRHNRDGDRRLMDSSSDQHRIMEKQHRVEESRSNPSEHSERNVSQKSSSNHNGQSQRSGNLDLHSKAPPAQSGNAQSLPSGDSNGDYRVVVGAAASNENVHIISETAVLSLWHQAHFEVDKMKYKSIGQYISHQKALRFNDDTSADDIMKAQSATSIIKCDKYIDGFDEKKWNSVYRDVIKDGCYYKFSQNKDLKQELLATSGSLLIYADVKDSKLGVGLKCDDIGIRDRKSWRGENALGFVLMEVCEDLVHGRDSSKTSRDEVSASEAIHNAPTEIIKECTKKDVEEQTHDRDMKTVTSEDKISLDTGNLVVTSPESPQNKGELQKDAEAVAIAPSAEYEKGKVNKLQKTKSPQETAGPEKTSLKDSVTLKKESLKETLISEKESPQETIILETESLQETSVLERIRIKESINPEKEGETAIPEKDNLQPIVIPKTMSEESTQSPQFSTNNQSGPIGAIKVVELPGSLKVPHEVEAAGLHSEQAMLVVDEETEVKSSQVTSQPCQTVPQSSHDDTRNNKTSTASDTPASSENDEMVMIAPHSEAVQTESECLAEKNVEETNIDVKDSVLAGIPELGLESISHQTTSSDKAASDETVTSETQTTSQNQANDGQNYEGTQTDEPHKLATNTLLGTQDEENTAEPGVGKQGKSGKFSTDSADDESDKAETVSMDTERKGLGAEATIADTCHVTSDKEGLAVERDTKEQSHSTKEDLSDNVVNEIHQEEALSMASEVEEQKVQRGIEEIVQQASDTVNEESDDDESSTECQPEEATSASITESIAHEKLPLKEELEKKSCTEGNQQVSSGVEKDSVEVHSQNASQVTSMTPVDNSSNAEISKEEDVLIAEIEVLGAQTNNENVIQVKEIKPVVEELEDESSIESIPDEASVPLTVKEILEVKASHLEASCQETNLVKDELNDETEAQLGDKSSVESIPEEAAVKDLVTEETNLEIKEEIVGKVEEELDDKSSTESNEAEANSTVYDKETSAPVADTDRTHPVTLTKEEIARTDTTETEASQQAIDVFGTKTDTPVLIELQTDVRNAENEEISDLRTSQMDDRNNPQTKPNHSLEVSSHS